LTSKDAGAGSTPLMQQYLQIKAQHQDAILFYRMGDFYEMFFEDAERAAKILDLTLTKRSDGIPLAGIPYRAAAEYLKTLVSLGHRVAICEQVEDPRLAKGIVKREVVEILTPGSVIEEGWLTGTRNNFLVALDGRGLAAIDASTGEFVLETLSDGALAEALARLAPREVVLRSGTPIELGDGIMVNAREPWEFDPVLAREELTRRFALASLDGFGLGPRDDDALGAAGALLRYLQELQPQGMPHLARPLVRRGEQHLWLDDMTRRNLELVEPLQVGTKGATLLEAIDRTVTPMGARLLRQRVLSPLRDPAAISERLDAVQVAVGDERGRRLLRDALDGVRDLERLAGRAAANRANPREMGALGDSFARLPALQQALGELRDLADSAELRAVHDAFDPCADLAADCVAVLVERPSAVLADGSIVRDGYDAELDALRSLRDGGKQHLAGMQARERERTGIPSLKVGFNKVFGYFLEITNAQSGKVPADYERRQTLAGAERFVTPELKEYEQKVLGAEERIALREAELFTAFRHRIGAAIGRIQLAAHAVARLDVHAALAELAVDARYARPLVDDGFDLLLTRCRHPVIERRLPRETFMPNDVTFTRADRVLLVTGPNMAGKSTILRQIGLCVILAQLGGFVPADAAHIGVVDRLFTRVGASDNLARGQSTFMVEMSETSAILHNATAQSLVLLDEIGRGTSTYDGVAIAWAVTEHLHDRIGAKTMFATHYHELMQLPEELQHARNLNVAVRETGDSIVFLHRLEAGGTDRSYGIHVAQLAGLPQRVVQRARAILGTLEGEHRMVPGAPPAAPDPGQFSFFAEAAPNPALEALRALDLNAMTPLDALNRLAALQQQARDA